MSVEWPIRKLSDLVTKVGSGATPLGGGTVYKKSGTPFIRSMNVRLEGFDPEGLVYLDSSQAAALDSVIVRADDVLLNITGASIGRVTKTPPEMDGSRVNQHVSIIRPNAALLPGFLCCYLASPEMQRQILEEESGATRQALTKAKILAFEIPLPPVNEQRRIVAKIEALQARTRKAREALEGVPALLEQYRQSVLAAAFRGDLTAEWREGHPDVEPASVLLDRIRQERRARWETAELARMKSPPRDDRWKAKYQEPEPVVDSELPELPEGWCWASLRELAWNASYGTSTKCDSEAAGVAVYRIPNVAQSEVNDEDLKFATEELGLSPDEYMAPGDLLIVRTNGSRDLIGRGALVAVEPQRPTYFASYLIRYRLLGGLDLGRWVGMIWQSPQIRSQLETMAATSAGQFNVSLSKLDRLFLPLPPLDEIRHLVRVARISRGRANDVEALVSESMDELQSFNRTILSKAFRGELVPQDPDDEPASDLLERIRAERASPNGVPDRARQRRLAGLE